MNITINNYADLIPTLTVPEGLKPDYEGVKQFTHNYSDWSFYHQDADVKKWFDLYFKKLAEANVGKSQEKPGKTKIAPVKKPRKVKAKAKSVKKARGAKAKEKPKRTAKAKAAAKPKKQAKAAKRKAVKAKAKPARKTIYNKAIPKVGTANMLMRRLTGFIGKSKPVSALVKLYQDIELANKQKQSIRNTQHFEVLKAVHKKLSHVVDQYEGRKVKIKLELADAELSSRIRAIAANRTDTTVAITKRFIRLQGTKPMPIVAKKLVADTQKAIKSGKMHSTQYTRSMLSTLNSYIEGKTKTVEISPSVLNGLQR